VITEVRAIEVEELDEVPKVKRTNFDHGVAFE